MTGLRAATALAIIALIVPAVGCGGGDTVSGPAPDAPGKMRLTSPAFADGGELPAKFNCSGAGVSPPLAWTGQPRQTKQFALLLEDPDAPDGTYVHWSLIDIAAHVDAIAADSIPAGAEQGRNSAGKDDYSAPCPPEGDPAHLYEFSIYALDRSIQLGAGAAPQVVRQGIRERAIAKGTLTARYGR